MTRIAAAVGVVTASLTAAAAAAGCGKVLVPSYTVPVVNSAWQAQLVAGGLTKPPSLMFDASGALLVVESGKGITRHKIVDNGGTCVSLSDSTVLIGQTSVRLPSSLHCVVWVTDSASSTTASPSPRTAKRSTPPQSTPSTHGST